MKITKILSLALVLLTLGANINGQDLKTETIPVSGNCEMCKNKIEKAAKTAGAAEADWNVDEKILTVKYNSSATNSDKIQQKIAATGYDTRDVKASNAAYEKLPGCCKYARKDAKTEVAMLSTEKKAGSCCDKENCSNKTEKKKKAVTKVN